MTELFPLLMVLPAIILLILACLPGRLANACPRAFRTTVTLLAAIQFLVSSCFAIAFAASWVPAMESTLLQFSGEFPVAATFYFDGVSSLMWTLVSFIGWVICQYSIRYLDGESTQGNYFRWTSFTIGSVSLMILSGNLPMFITTWVMTSMGLHRLLLHFGHRPAARRAAWTKFTISRIGDVGLLAAMSIIYSEFKTLEFVKLFELANSTTSTSLDIQVAGLLLVLGAITKSAQVPFHTWLPQTMETPTPVSALMHAGIVNAGGFLVIRTSPIISLTPWALTTLAIVGGVTACYAAVVMLTQTSIKKSLAYSTIAQMGFMLLQCGLGAYSAAMLHILAHSLYKAHAFLGSGSVIAERAATRGAMTAEKQLSWINLTFAGAIMVVFLGTALWLFGIDPVKKPGGLLLGGVLCLALTYWTGQVMRSGKTRLLVHSTAISVCLCLLYAASFSGIDRMIAASLPATSSPKIFWLVSGLVLLGFTTMFALQVILSSGYGISFLKKWYVHASNGFYMESILRRVFGPLLNT